MIYDPKFTVHNIHHPLLKSFIYMTPCTNHIAIKYHHCCSRVKTSFHPSGDIKIKYIFTKKQLADIFIKPVDADSFFHLCNLLCDWWFILILFCLQLSVRIHDSTSISGFYFGFKTHRLIMLKLTILLKQWFHLMLRLELSHFCTSTMWRLLRKGCIMMTIILLKNTRLFCLNLNMKRMLNQKSMLEWMWMKSGEE